MLFREEIKYKLGVEPSDLVFLMDFLHCNLVWVSVAWLKGLLNIAQTWKTCGKVRARGINHIDVQVSKFEDKAKQTQRWKRDGKYEAVA